jgi:2-dehydropantoate 2-reductase
MRILILGAGVIGSVYAGRLHEAGHEVTLFVRGKRLTDLRTSGLILDDARSGHRTTHHLPVLASLDTEQQFVLVLVSVRREQFAGAAAQLATSSVEGDVMLFGNATGLTHELVALLVARALLGFPAAGGVRDGGFSTRVSTDADAWLIAHAAVRSTRRMCAVPR